jgi:Penicillin-insensitive murein endopeptidase
VSRLKSAHVGLLCGVGVFAVGMGVLVMGRRAPALPQATLPVVSVAVPVPSASIASAEPAQSVAAAPVPAPTAEVIPEKPKRCLAEPILETSKKDLPASEPELFRILQDNPRALGSASIGTPTRGFLFAGLELKESDGIKHEGGYAWGTELVIRSIERAVREVRRCFPNTPILRVGDISRDKGGWLRPHRSHQSGLDVDMGYYYRVPAGWYEKATSSNLDLARTWSLVRAFIEGGNVDTVFMDLTVQRILKAYVETLPLDEQPPGEWFQTPLKKDTPIRHAWGHLTHFHVRFRDPEAVALGAKIKDLVPKLQPKKKTPKRR